MVYSVTDINSIIVSGAILPGISVVVTTVLAALTDKFEGISISAHKNDRKQALLFYQCLES